MKKILILSCFVISGCSLLAQSSVDPFSKMPSITTGESNLMGAFPQNNIEVSFWLSNDSISMVFCFTGRYRAKADSINTIELTDKDREKYKFPCTDIKIINNTNAYSKVGSKTYLRFRGDLSQLKNKRFTHITFFFSNQTAVSYDISNDIVNNTFNPIGNYFHNLQEAKKQPAKKHDEAKPQYQTFPQRSIMKERPKNGYTENKDGSLTF